VSFSYPGTDRTVVERISFVARAGETVALVGPTGSGKSTLVAR
jgi:ATP-binding cassette subfamily B protein